MQIQIGIHITLFHALQVRSENGNEMDAKRSAILWHIYYEMQRFGISGEDIKTHPLYTHILLYCAYLHGKCL
jgi:hypothetical protein